VVSSTTSSRVACLVGARASARAIPAPRRRAAPIAHKRRQREQRGERVHAATSCSWTAPRRIARPGCGGLSVDERQDACWRAATRRAWCACRRQYAAPSTRAHVITPWTNVYILTKKSPRGNAALRKRGSCMPKRLSKNSTSAQVPGAFLWRPRSSSSRGLRPRACSTPTRTRLFPSARRPRLSWTACHCGQREQQAHLRAQRLFGETSTGFSVGSEVFAFYMACAPGRTRPPNRARTLTPAFPTTCSVLTCWGSLSNRTSQSTPAPVIGLHS